MEDSLVSPETETVPNKRLARLKFQKATAKLYEEIIRSTHVARDKQSNEGIASATAYVRNTANSLIALFQTVEDAFEDSYLQVYAQRTISAEDEAWLREQVKAVVGEQLARVQEKIENLCSSFTGSSPQQYARYIESARSEAVLMSARINDSITIHLLEHQTTSSAAHDGNLPRDAKAQWDVFISHASEDKSYTETLASKLTEAGVRVWFDRTAIDWGDDIRETIDHGLINCRFGIVIFSKAFLAKKKWIEYELSSLFALEEPGRKRILPIWHGVTEAEMKRYSPGFSARLAKISTRDSYEQIVQSVKILLSKTSADDTQSQPPAPQPIRPDQLGPTIADARYDMVGKADPQISFIVRTINDGSDDCIFETWMGTPLELSSTFRATRDEVALKYLVSDKEMQLKGYKRMGNGVGDMAFNLP